MFSLLVNCISHNLLNFKLLCFADNMKLFMRIDSPNGCIKLQSDLDCFITWFKALGLTLNLDKYCVMTYSRSQTPIVNIFLLFGYNILHID